MSSPARTLSGMITVFIRYKIDPTQLSAYEEYARRLLEIIPRLGGDLIGYFLPHEGTNYIAFGVIRFPSLAEYEAYRERLKTDEACVAALAFAREGKFILEESRSFLKQVV